MNVHDVRRVAFLGIGGIGMSALARYFHARGATVTGYDRTPTLLTAQLEREGISIHYEEDISRIMSDAQLVVYTPAIPSDHAELVYYQQRGYPVLKRAEVLQLITAELFTIAIAGTHGKTTTAALIAHVLKSCGIDCMAFLGGIALNYHSNFLDGTSGICVVEADEFDRSFLKLRPDVAVVTSCDPDHLDIYEAPEEVVRSFGDFASRLKAGGVLITRPGLAFLPYVNFFNIHFYGIHQEADVRAHHIEPTEIGQRFAVTWSKGTIGDIHLPLPGGYNVENAVAAVAVGLYLEANPEQIKKGLETFRGVKRRFEWIRRTERYWFIDDYAHHPVEIEAFLGAVRQLCGPRLITCVFQPHLYSRTRDFAEGFGKALSLADRVILLPIYAAREAPLEGVDSSLLLGYLTGCRAMLASKQELFELLRQQPPEVLVTVGAGDIDELVMPLAQMLDQL
ncbi:MAG: UDP-N-acetylmuramate--L-alanine ligase [Chitinophagales bacterium]|nr:UDP-N-acetylmuramate--L-alanine ligase [Chitinophagales bacterium]MDW8428738.1 UDP-N-acetylmuramate--L-alanine ligase [Chitinophagales bacterium]